MNQMEPPLLSVITITYQNDEGLCYTINSIPDNIEGIEHIIVDGGATSTTRNLLVNYKKQRSWLSWISEQDQGIYDAMNKGLKLAKGDYVIFMNAGDGFYDPMTISHIVETLRNDDIDVLYGDAMFRNQENIDLGVRSDITRKTIPDNLSIKNMKDGMIICHQSFIAKRSIAPTYQFDNISADYKWMIEIVRRSLVLVNFEGVISNYLIGGVSQRRHKESLIGRFKIMVEEFGVRTAFVSHVKITWRAVFGIRTTN